MGTARSRNGRCGVPAGAAARTRRCAARRTSGSRRRDSEPAQLSNTWIASRRRPPGPRRTSTAASVSRSSSSCHASGSRRMKARATTWSRLGPPSIRYAASVNGAPQMPITPAVSPRRLASQAGSPRARSRGPSARRRHAARATSASDAGSGARSRVRRGQLQLHAHRFDEQHHVGEEDRPVDAERLFDRASADLGAQLRRARDLDRPTVTLAQPLVARQRPPAWRMNQTGVASTGSRRYAATSRAAPVMVPGLPLGGGCPLSPSGSCSRRSCSCRS